MRIFLFLPILLFGVTKEYAFKALDPILPLNQLQFENDYTPVNAHVSGNSNIFYLKPLAHIDANSVIPIAQGIRFQIPLVTTPNPQPTTNLGDTQFLDLFLWEGAWGEAGFGPMAIFPTALKNATGQGKWCLGPAVGFLLNFPKTQFGLLAQNPISFAGDGHREGQNYLLFQPFLFQHLGEGWYLKSNPQWNFDWLHRNQRIPINFGAGRVFQVGKQALNIDLVLETMAYQNTTITYPQFTMQFTFAILFE